jgi:hypothetical protein
MVENLARSNDKTAKNRRGAAAAQRTDSIVRDCFVIGTGWECREEPDSSCSDNAVSSTIW